jgi:hypothetical protein
MKEMRNDFGNSIVWPLSLAGFGVAALSTAIILVPSMARMFAEEHKADARPCPAEASAEAPTAEKAAPTEKAQPLKETPEAAAVGKPVPAATPVHPAATPSPPVAGAQGPWIIELNPDDYAFLGGADAAIDAIVAVLARDSDAKVVLTGVNRPAQSSKRAMRAAEIVRARIVADVGVAVRQVETRRAQDPTVEGLVVRAELDGGGR